MYSISLRKYRKWSIKKIVFFDDRFVEGKSNLDIYKCPNLNSGL